LREKKMAGDSKTGRWDGVAIALSSACLVHCLILPIAAAALPIFATAAEAEWVHWVFVAFAVPVSILALRHPARTSALTFALRAGAVVGLTLLVMGALGWPSHDLEAPITVAGGLILGGVHLLNFFKRRHSHAPLVQSEISDI
jgi:MerC mercury resistance protein